MSQSKRKETCADRVGAHYRSRIDDIDSMLNLQRSDIRLGDDGTLDTLVYPGSLAGIRFHDASEYRDDDGTLDLDAFLDEYFDAIRDDCYDRLADYGLSFDWVAPGTFDGQREGYYRYQLSCGGPSEEFRFYVNPDGSWHRIEFWFLDWFDGASLDVSDDPRAAMLADYFADLGMLSNREE